MRAESCKLYRSSMYRIGVNKLLCCQQRSVSVLLSLLVTTHIHFTGVLDLLRTLTLGSGSASRKYQTRYMSPWAGSGIKKTDIYEAVSRVVRTVNS